MACEVAWFSALCDDDYEYLGVADPALRSSWEHCRDIALAAESAGYDNLLLPSGYAMGIDSVAFAAGIAPLLRRMIEAPGARWNEEFPASRETAEMRAETVQMGYSLAKLSRNLGIEVPEIDEMTFPMAFACAVRHWCIDPRQALVAYLWAWLENQVMAAVKAVPLGQTDGQKILLALGARLHDAREGETGNFAPGLAMLSSLHETQYSRLFRS